MAQSPQFINWLINQPTVLDPSMFAATTMSFPLTVSYTLQSTDYLRTISSFSAGGTLTITLPSSIPSGFMFLVFRDTNNIILSAAGGNFIQWLVGNIASSVTLITQNQLVLLVFDGTVWKLLGHPPVGVPNTYQSFLSGSGNYTPTAGTLRIKVRMCGGGGGGGAETTNAGSVGTDTSFGAWTAIHGNGGGTAGGAGGAGGTGGVNGTGILILRLNGSSGGGGSGSSVATVNLIGGSGGMNFFGGYGAGSGNSNTSGTPPPNTGGGGAGASGVGANNSGAGGGAGEYVEFMVTSPGTIAFVVGGGGNGGTAGGVAGGNGAAGIILVEEFYC